LSAAVTITDNSADSPQSIALSGTGAVPIATLSVVSISFPNENIGSTSPSQQVTLTNTGLKTLLLSSIAVTGPNASSFGFLNNCGTYIAVGASCTIHGHFAPTTGGPLNASITITDNAADSPQSIALSGTGAVPIATLSATSISFPNENIGSASPSQQVTLTNTGWKTLLLSSITVTGPNASSFDFANSCGTYISVGASCTIHGHFAPTATGPASATITIIDNAADSPQTIAIGGTGQ